MSIVCISLSLSLSKQNHALRSDDKNSLFGVMITSIMITLFGVITSIMITLYGVMIRSLMITLFGVMIRSLMITLFGVMTPKFGVTKIISFSRIRDSHV